MRSPRGVRGIPGRRRTEVGKTRDAGACVWQRFCPYFTIFTGGCFCRLALDFTDLPTVTEYLSEHLHNWPPFSWLPGFGRHRADVTDYRAGWSAPAHSTSSRSAAAVFHLARCKVAGRIQDRLGPTRVGGKFGWLQTLADGLKLITKEDLMPKGAMGCCSRSPRTSAFALRSVRIWRLPFSDGWVALNLNIGVFFILAVMGLEVFGVILAGYASASKWSLFGSMREAAQVVSYEVPMGMCVVVPVLDRRLSMNLVRNRPGASRAGSRSWLILHDPFTFITFWVYFTCATASVNRAPFDLAEAESELVAGFHTEYSGLRWSYLLHGRVRLDVRRQRTGRDPVFRRLERPVADHVVAGSDA